MPSKRFPDPIPGLTGKTWEEISPELQQFLFKLAYGIVNTAGALFKEIDPEAIMAGDSGDPGTDAAGYAAADHRHSVNTGPPVSLALSAGGMSEGTQSALARADHTHAMQIRFVGQSAGVTANVSAVINEIVFRDNPDPSYVVWENDVSKSNETGIVMGYVPAVSALSAAIDAVSNALSVEIANRISADNALSNAISSLASQHLSLVNRVSANSGAGGGGSVTSDEVSAVSAQAASAISNLQSSLLAAINVVSNGLSNEISVRASAVSAVSHAVSLLSQQNSVDHVSIRNLISVLSNTNSSEHAALSVRIDTQSQSISALSQAHSVLSQANSADHVSIRNLISVVSNALSALEVRVSTLSATPPGSASVTSNELSNILSNVLSNTLSLLDVVSAQAASAIGVVSAELASTKEAIQLSLDNLSAAVSSIESNLSLLLSDINNLSVRNTAGNSVTDELQVILDTLSNRISAVSTAAGGSVTSTEVSAVSAQAASAISAVSAQAASAISALAVRVNVASVILANLGQRTRVLQNITTISATTLTNISGMSASVDAGGTYRVEAMLLHTHSAANAYGFGLTFPTAVAGGFVQGLLSVGAAGVSAFTAGRMVGGAFNQAASGSIILSGAVGASAVVYPIMLDAIFRISTAGIIQLQARVSATGTGAIHFQIGSYMRVWTLI